MVTVEVLPLTGVCTAVTAVLTVTVSLKLSGTGIGEPIGVVWEPVDSLVSAAVGVGTDLLKLPVVDAVLSDTAGGLVIIVVVIDCTVDVTVADDDENIVSEHVNVLSWSGEGDKFVVAFISSAVPVLLKAGKTSLPLRLPLDTNCVSVESVLMVSWLDNGDCGLWTLGGTPTGGRTRRSPLEGMFGCKIVGFAAGGWGSRILAPLAEKVAFFSRRGLTCKWKQRTTTSLLLFK